MIYFYSGTPGSGKSLKVAQDIVTKIRIRKQTVITNMIISEDYIRQSKSKVLLQGILKVLGSKRKIDTCLHDTGRVIYKHNNDLTPEFLFEYALTNHKRGQEGQTLLIIDEAQMMFGPTVVKLKSQQDKEYRTKWLDFCTQHRHLGYNVILVSQFDRLIDPQIRCLFEYNYIHRKVNNFGVGWLLSLFKISLFIQVEYWYGVNQKNGFNFFTYNKKYSKIYDSYSRFDLLLQERALKQSLEEVQNASKTLDCEEEKTA